jgi:hypothetical protein
VGDAAARAPGRIRVRSCDFVTPPRPKAQAPGIKRHIILRRQATPSLLMRVAAGMLKVHAFITYWKAACCHRSASTTREDRATTSSDALELAEAKGLRPGLHVDFEHVCGWIVPRGDANRAVR